MKLSISKLTNPILLLSLFNGPNVSRRSHLNLNPPDSTSP